MKKICFITTVSLTLDMFVVETAKYIHDNTDWDITFICNNDEDFASRLPNFIHFHPISMERGVSIAGVKAMLEMRKFFKKQKFDMIQYSTPNASLYASIAGKLAKVPVRLYCQWGIAYVGFEGIKRKIFKAIEKTVCRLSTWIEPDSKSNLSFSHAEGLYPTSIGSVIGSGSACGVDFKKFNIEFKNKYRETVRGNYRLPNESFVFGYVGRITKDKGINELLSAFKTISAENSNTFLMLVGPDEEDDTVDNELIKWAKESEQVIFVGFTRVVEQYLSAMDCFVLPSYREGFGMGVVEAEAMGVPVIITNIPGPIDAMVQNRTGEIVEKKDAAGLTAAMNKLLKDRDLCEKYGNAGIDHAYNNFERVKLFEKILDDRISMMK